MATKNLPCSRCGSLMWRGKSSLPEGNAVCQPCRREQPQPYTRVDRYIPRPCAHCGRAYTDPARGTCSDRCARLRMGTNVRRLNSIPTQPLPCDDCGELTTRGRNQAGRFCVACAKGRRRASYSAKAAKRRAVERLSDITASYLSELIADARCCPMCDVQMTDHPGCPESKHVDHIVPMAIGGTHTVGNVRVICRTCNLARPHDGSDLAGHQPTLWAQDLNVAESLVSLVPDHRPRCVCGSVVRQGRCWRCEPSRRRAARTDEGQRAAVLRACGVGWQDIADQLGFSGPGAAYICASKWGDPDAIAQWPRRTRQAS